MKKALIILAFISICFTLTQKEEDYVIVPKNSIRFRIIPNSNSFNDLFIKEEVKKELKDVLVNIETTNTIEETREQITKEIPLIKTKINNVFSKNNYNKDFNINFGYNYFPEKIYKGVKYEEGKYESLVIEIGESKGDNYWCVLFPPLCLIEAEETEDVEYSFFISEIINKYF